MSWNQQHDYFVSWDELHRASKELARRQLPAQQWQGIIAVARGGLIPAAIVARELNLRYVDSICVSSYDQTVQRDEVELLKDLAVHTDGEGFLVIDDLVDTGNTYRYLRKRLPKAKFITVYAKPKGRETVDDYVIEVDQQKWIHFPWDMSVAITPPLAEQDHD